MTHPPFCFFSSKVFRTIDQPYKINIYAFLAFNEHGMTDKHFSGFDRNLNYVPQRLTRYRINVISPDASDTTTSNTSDRKLDKFSDDLSC